MQTHYWSVTKNDIRSLNEAANLLKNGSTVAFPTETVYGLGADATNQDAVSRIFKAKGRPQDNPLIAHVASKRELRQLVMKIPLFAEKLIDRFSPGPITYVLPSNGACAENVTAGLSTIAVRIPNHPVAQQLLHSCKLPIAAPSANTSGKPSPTTALHVWDDLAGKIAGIVDGGQTGIGMESTVIDCTKDNGPIILRPGGITKKQIEEVTETVVIDPAIVQSNRQPLSPGLKYRHYSPEVPLWLVDGSPQVIQKFIDQEQLKSNRIGVLARTETAKQLKADQIIPLGDGLKEVATNLYDALRLFKKDDIDLIVCESFPETDIGEAIMNRLRKAASYQT